MKKSVSIIIMAFNEEKNVKPTILGVISSIQDVVSDYELIVINDGSTDNTQEVIEKLEKSHRKIRLINHPRNMGFGYSFKDGLSISRKSYVVGFPGDNDTSTKLLRDLILASDSRDVIISYTKNSHGRSIVRRIISKLFVIFMNLIFGLRLRYYNGSFICKTTILKKMKLNSAGFTIYAESNVKLLKAGYTYREIPFNYLGRKYGTSKAVGWKSFRQTMESVICLIYEIYFKRGLQSSDH